MTSQAFVSVITPLYNGEKFLSECIESVLTQTYKNFEYIIVDNCSSDGSLEIINNYCGKDNRIVLYRNNKFVSAIENHNIAFKKISPVSRYCKVIHADDWLFPDCLERMVAVGEQHNSVGIVGSYRLDGVRVNLDGLPYPSTVTNGQEICRRSLLSELYVFGSPTSLLIRSDIVRQRIPFYDEINFNLQADIAACYEILKNYDFGFVHQVLTCSRRHKETLTTALKKIDQYSWSKLMFLTKYGAVYLTPEEYTRSFDYEMKSYYSFLAKSLFQSRGEIFWDYHQKQFEKLGIALSKRKLFYNVFSLVTDIIFNQKRLIAAAARGIKSHLPRL
jgi:glycosyltransferase involved in cell wall biosynthesis